MQNYKIIINIIKKVLLGENLNNTFKFYIYNEKDINIGKIKDISYGVIRYYEKFNIVFNELAKHKKCNINIFIIIMIGFYELSYTKKQQYSVINFLVNVSYDFSKDVKTKNFVNAILRNYIRLFDVINEKYKTNLEYKYSIKKLWINKIKLNYPDNYISILETINNIPKIFLRINKKKISEEHYKYILIKNNIKFELYNSKIILNNTITLQDIPLLNDGFVSIQNISAQKILDIAILKDNMEILDACCAPGGKLCQILENYSVNITGLDINKKRLILVQENLHRLGLFANLIVGDASTLNWWNNKKYDFIIADVPCSASGTLKKNPDIKLNRTVDELNKITKLQKIILKNLFSILKNNGKLLYITCSIFNEENEDNIKWFIQDNKNVKILNEIKIIPNEYEDGFYYCLLEKKEN